MHLPWRVPPKPRYTHVDNYCHGLIIAEKQIYETSPHLGTSGKDFLYFFMGPEIYMGYDFLHNGHNMDIMDLKQNCLGRIFSDRSLKCLDGSGCLSSTQGNSTSARMEPHIRIRRRISPAIDFWLPNWRLDNVGICWIYHELSWYIWIYLVYSYSFLWLHLRSLPRACGQGYSIFWNELNEAVVGMGFDSLYSRVNALVAQCVAGNHMKPFACASGTITARFPTQQCWIWKRNAKCKLTTVPFKSSLPIIKTPPQMVNTVIYFYY